MAIDTPWAWVSIHWGVQFFGGNWRVDLVEKAAFTEWVSLRVFSLEFRVLCCMSWYLRSEHLDLPVHLHFLRSAYYLGGLLRTLELTFVGYVLGPCFDSGVHLPSMYVR